MRTQPYHRNLLIRVPKSAQPWVPHAGPDDLRAAGCGVRAWAATMAGHDTCPSTAAAFPAEVAMVFVSAISSRADRAASRRRRGHLAGATAALSR